MARTAFLPVVAVLLAVAVGCGDGTSSKDIPAGAVATVGDVEISKRDLDQQIAALVRADRSGGDGARQQRDQLASQALSALLLREALDQEAADRDITVAQAQVRRRWNAAAQTQFKNKKALRRFLGRQTKQDVLTQIRLQVLTERIHKQVSEEAGGGKQGAKAVLEFQTEFQKRWQDRAACADGYTASGCAEDDESE